MTSSPSSTGSPPTEPPTLGEGVEKFLVAFARAVQKHAMYPAGHPALEPAARSVAGALDRALEGGDRLELSVAPDRVAVGGASTDPESDLFRSMARRLHRHHVSLVALHAGAGADEAHRLLEALAEEPDGERAAGFRFDGRIPGCPHVEVRPVPYAAMTLDGDSRELREEARSLWFELARAARGAEEGDVAEEDVSLEPGDVARAVATATGGDREYARRVVERLSEAAHLFRDTRRREEPGALGTLSERMGTLIDELPPEVFVRLLEEGSTPERARQILFDASYQLEPESLGKVLETVADVRFVEISGWLGRIFGKLESHARSDDPAVRDAADDGMREQIRDLVARWELDNPNPADYEEALSRLALRDRGGSGDRMADADAGRMIRMGLELDAGGDWIAGAAGGIEDREESRRLVRDLMETPGEVEATADVWRGLLSPGWIRDFMAPPEPEPELARAVVARCGPGRAETLLDVLSGADSRALRRVVFDRLVELGEAVGPAVIRRLDREEWFVRRNLLALLNAMDRLPDGFSARPYLAADHPEVRHEAIALALRDPELRGQAIRTALEDPHSRTVILGLTAARETCPESAVPAVLEAARDGELSWTVRLHAIRALGGMDAPAARNALIALSTRRAWPLFWRRRVRSPSPPVLEALRTLHRGWRDDPRAAELLDRARRDGADEIRRAARGEDRGETP